MPMRFRQNATYYGQVGKVVTTVSLVTKQELESQFKQATNKSESVSKILRRGETHITIPNRFSSEVLKIPLQELIQAYKDQNIDELFILIQNRFQPDPNEVPLYPSDMVDQYRQMGMPEAQIQELLLREQRTRNT